MTVVRPTPEQLNLYARLCRHLNLNNGEMAVNHPLYYGFLDKNRVEHPTVIRAIVLCQKLYAKPTPYVLHVDGRVTKSEGGTLYLTKDGSDIVKNVSDTLLPPIVQIVEPEPVTDKKIWMPELKKQKREDDWTKDEVIHLLTKQAHLVGRMLGTGYDLLEPMHGEWISEWLLNPKGLGVLIHQAHRASYKTSALRLACAITVILQPLQTLLIIRKSEDAVKELVNGISKILETPLFHRFVEILHPDIKAKGGFKKTTDTALAVDTNLNVSLSGEYQIRALGLGSPFTGKHAGKIVTDDICFVAGTKIATPFGDRDIEDLVAGDLVITPFGYRKIVNTKSRHANVIQNCGLTGTANHPIYNKNENRFDNLDVSLANNLSRLSLNNLKKWQASKMLINSLGHKEDIISCGCIFNKNLNDYQQPLLCTIQYIISTIKTFFIWALYKSNLTDGAVGYTKSTEYQKVYNLEVEACHVYYANGILVHNCTTADRESDAERRATILKYQELMNLLSHNKGFSNTMILNIGTPWHEEDVFQLMERGLVDKNEEQESLESIPTKDRTRKQNERIRQLNMLRGKFVYNCYQTGLMSQKDIDWKKKTLNDNVLFSANYLLSLVSDDEKPFPRINNVGRYSKSIFKESWEVFAAIDAAYAGEDTCTLAIGCYDWETNCTVVYGKVYKVPLDENYMELAQEMYDCGVQTLFMETNTDKGLMGQKFRELGFNAVGYHESMNKHTKIVGTIRPFWREEGQACMPCVQFVSETDEQYLSQIYNYKKGVKKDDAPDNLACLLLKSKFGATTISAF